MSGAELGEVSQVQEHRKPEVTLLDLYSGCGAMSTGLCLGANLNGLNLVTVSFMLHAMKDTILSSIFTYLFVLVNNVFSLFAIVEMGS